MLVTSVDSELSSFTSVCVLDTVVVTLLVGCSEEEATDVASVVSAVSLAVLLKAVNAAVDVPLLGVDTDVCSLVTSVVC